MAFIFWSNLWSLGPNPIRIATNRWLLVALEPQARSLYRPRITQKETKHKPCGWREWVVLIYEWKKWEVKCLGLHVMGYAPTVRSTTNRPRVTKEQRWCGAPVLRHQAPRAVDLLVLQTWPIGQVALAYIMGGVT